MKTKKTIIVDERAGLEVEGMVVVAVSSRGERGKESPCWANTPDHVVDASHAQGTLGCRYGVNASSPPPCRGGEGRESPCWATTPDPVVDGCHAQGTLGCRYGVNASSLPPPPCRGGEDGHRADKREKTLITAGKEDTGNE